MNQTFISQDLDFKKSRCRLNGRLTPANFTRKFCETEMIYCFSANKWLLKYLRPLVINLRDIFFVKCADLSWYWKYILRLSWDDILLVRRQVTYEIFTSQPTSCSSGMSEGLASSLTASLLKYEHFWLPEKDIFQKAFV